jgi:hypothetical protein
MVTVEAPWDAVRYFSTHDIIESDGGLGRSSYFNFFGVWAADVMGFWVALPWVIGTRDFVLDYLWVDLGGGFGRNKHGLGWWPEGVTGGGGLDSPAGGGFLGCWDPAVGGGYNFFLGAALQTKTSIVSPASPVNTPTYRRISRVGDTWSVLDGPEFPADGTLGHAEWTAAGVEISAFPGFRMAGTHRVMWAQWQLA